MPTKNLIKFCAFSILICAAVLFTANCSGVFPQDAFKSNNGGLDGDAVKSPDYAAPRVAGRIKDDAISESSGIAASRCNAGAYWTHNDSDDDAFLYAFNIEGEKLGVWRVPAAKNIDWEDIAAFKDAGGKCFLYVADIGNNKRSRGELTIYKVLEPAIDRGNKDSNKKDPVFTAPADEIKIEYPEMRYDAEALLVHPQTGDIYILTKSYSGDSQVYKLAAASISAGVNKMQLLGQFRVPAIPPGAITGADISPDGARVAICDYFNGYELVLPASAKNFDDIWKEKPLVVELGPRKTGESIGYGTDGKFLIAGSEGQNSPVIVVDRK